MIHQYILNGYHIVLDVNSGSIHTVDPLAYDVIGLFQVTTKEEIIEAMLDKYVSDSSVNREEILEVLEDIQTLQDAGQLFSEPVLRQPMDASVQKASQNSHVAEESQSPQVVKALCLHVAHTCNLNCEYCFASQGKFQGDRALMSFEVGKQAIDFLIANSGSRHNLEVDFFGGEPLMNWEVVKQIVAYARSEEKKHSKNFRFTLTTNGILIDDDVMDFCNREIHNVVLSLDGRKEIHDKLRRTFGDQGSYANIVPKFQAFVDSREGKGYYIRGTFTHNNIDFTEDLFHMADLGFKELSMEPVVCAPGESYALTQEDLQGLYRQYELLAKEMLKREKEGNPFTFYHYTLDLTEGPCIYKRITGCGSGTEYLAVTPWGELFPCHQFVGDAAYSMGDVWTGVNRPDLQQNFRSCNVFSRQECRDCWAQLYCSGGCAANSYHAGGDIAAVYEYGCDLFRKRMECAIMMNIARQEEA
jgi:uncharacterized protein